MGTMFRKATVEATVNLQRLENTILVHIAESFQSKYLDLDFTLFVLVLNKSGLLFCYSVDNWKVGVLTQNKLLHYSPGNS